MIQARRYNGLLPTVLCMQMRRVFGFLAASVVVSASVACAQDSQSLGDAARQARLQKQQKEAQVKDAPAKDAQSKDVQASSASSKDAQPPKPPTKVVITNDDLPQHVGSTLTSPRTPTQAPTYVPPSYAPPPGAAEQWKSAIQTQKNAIVSMQGEIANLSDSIHFAGNCVADCVQWNERQKEKQDQLERMKTQLEQQQQRLEVLQDAARKQGFGSSIYDP
jgi:hypothetical protein